MKSINEFWAKFPSHIGYLEQCVKLGHNEEFKLRYNVINEEVKKLHPALQVEFNIEMLEAKVDAIIVTSKEKGEGRKAAIKIAENCPANLKSMVTPYRLPALGWELEVTDNWMLDLCRQYGMPSIAGETSDCLVNAKCAIKKNPSNEKLLIQFSFKNKRELKAIDEELVFLMFDLLLGEQIIAEAIDSLSINTQKDMMARKGDWVITDGLGFRDEILKALM
ncbi:MULTISPECIES: hypothetical protein [unclassified Pseudoalteromonas]|uniref:hypothetical protein n=1 Tax=unclassified Pseudoalteromonas TaxID=194690 RepID=UPI0004264F63|nr:MULTISPECIES: hypothetical protein [unclassified Pseudoalteromonas]